MRLLVFALDLEGRPAMGRADALDGADHVAILLGMMRPTRFSASSAADPDEFMDNCLAAIAAFTGLRLEAPGATLAERARAFISGLVGSGLAAWVN
jgi:hypothetical protein